MHYVDSVLCQSSPRSDVCSVLFIRPEMFSFDKRFIFINNHQIDQFNEIFSPKEKIYFPLVQLFLQAKQSLQMALVDLRFDW
jgi:hypothetical protein